MRHVIFSLNEYVICYVTIYLFLKTAISILLISNHNSFRVRFDKIASIYFVWKIYLYFSIGNGQPREPALCRLYRHSFVPYKSRVPPCTATVNMTLPAFVAGRRRLLSVEISCPRGAQQQTRRLPSLLSVGRTDGPTLERYIDPDPHTMRTLSKRRWNRSDNLCIPVASASCVNDFYYFYWEKRDRLFSTGKWTFYWKWIRDWMKRTICVFGFELYLAS